MSRPPKIKIKIPRGPEPTLAQAQASVDRMLAPPRRETFPTSLLTESEREAGWYVCADASCRPTFGGRKISGPHIHRDIKPEKSR